MITPGGQTPKFWQENHIFYPNNTLEMPNSSKFNILWMVLLEDT